jgi:hypothetical protein
MCDSFVDHSVPSSAYGASEWIYGSDSSTHLCNSFLLLLDSISPLFFLAKFFLEFLLIHIVEVLTSHEILLLVLFSQYR